MYEKLYRDLLLRYNALEGENKRLLEENARMRQQLGIMEQEDNDEKSVVNKTTTINKYSSSKEKIELFRSLSVESFGEFVGHTFDDLIYIECGDPVNDEFWNHTCVWTMKIF